MAKLPVTLLFPSALLLVCLALSILTLPPSTSSGQKQKAYLLPGKQTAYLLPRRGAGRLLGPLSLSDVLGHASDLSIHHPFEK